MKNERKHGRKYQKKEKNETKYKEMRKPFQNRRRNIYIKWACPAQTLIERTGWGCGRPAWRAPSATAPRNRRQKRRRLTLRNVPQPPGMSQRRLRTSPCGTLAARGSSSGYAVVFAARTEWPPSGSLDSVQVQGPLPRPRDRVRFGSGSCRAQRRRDLKYGTPLHACARRRRLD